MTEDNDKKKKGDELASLGKKILLESLPAAAINWFQLYLVLGKIFSFGPFKDLSWWAVFIPLWADALVTAVMYILGSDERK